MNQLLEHEIKMAARFHRASDHPEPFKSKSHQNWHSENALEGAWQLLKSMEGGEHGEEGLPDLYSYIMVFRAVRYHQNDLEQAFTVFNQLRMNAHAQ